MSGVRSSCEALATNWRCASNEASRRPSSSSKVSPSSRSSSLGPSSARRSCRLEAESSRAAVVITCSGRSTRPASNHPSAIDATAMSARRDERPDQQLMQVAVVDVDRHRPELMGLGVRVLDREAFRCRRERRPPAAPLATPCRSTTLATAPCAETMAPCAEWRTVRKMSASSSVPKIAEDAAVEHGEAQADRVAGKRADRCAQIR